MRQLLLIALLLFCASAKAKTTTFTICWRFKNVVQNYNHENRIEVYIDGKNVGTSSVFKLTDNASYTLKVARGSHSIKIVNYTNYHGRWEQHVVENQYSVDAQTECKYHFKLPTTLSLVWDETNPSVSLVSNWVESASSDEDSEELKKSVSLKVVWKFENVVEGYDPDIRLQVFAQDSICGTSNGIPASKGGKFKTNIPDGNYKLEIRAEAYRDGAWEDYNVANDYAVDAFVKESAVFHRSLTVLVTFDIKTGKVSTVWKNKKD